MNIKKLRHMLEMPPLKTNVLYRMLRFSAALHKNSELQQLFSKTLSDKAIPGHGYHRCYETFFAEKRLKVQNVLEIGLLGHGFQKNSLDEIDNTGVRSEKLFTSVPSLDVWSKYFPNAKIVGFDLQDFQTTSPRIKVYQGDQSDRNDLEKVLQASEQYDLIIDDALHASPHQQISFSFLFQYVKPGGYYVIEDLFWQPPAFEQQGTPTTINLLNKLRLDGVWQSPHATKQEKNFLEMNTDTISIFDSLKSIEQSADARVFQDAIAFIKRRDAAT